jgi:hypothetical protein
VSKLDNSPRTIFTRNFGYPPIKRSVGVGDLANFFADKITVTFLSFLTIICQGRNSYRGQEESSILRGGGTIDPLSLSSPPTSHPESSLALAYSPPTMAAKRLNLPPVPSTVPSFPLYNAPLPTPAGWWRQQTPLSYHPSENKTAKSDVTLKLR